MYTAIYILYIVDAFKKMASIHLQAEKKSFQKSEAVVCDETLEVETWEIYNEEEGLTKKMKADKEKLVKSYVKKLALCNVELDTLSVTLRAFKDGLISKENLERIISLHPQVPISERRINLLKLVHETLQEKIKGFELRISTLPIPETIALAMREGLITKDVLDHLTSLHVQVPTEMRLRYLLMCVYTTLKGKLEELEKRISQIKALQLESKSHPLEFARKEMEEGLIDQCILDHLIAIYPNLPRKLNRHEVCANLNKRIKKKELKLSSHLTRLHGKLSLNLDTFNSIISQITDLTLGLEQLTILNESLVSYAYKWRDVGIALNFHPQDLNNIQASSLLVHDSPESYLTRLLEDWLLKKHGYTLHPTIDNLKKALCRQTVGLGILASELQTILFKHTIEHAVKLPYSSIRTSLAALEASIFLKYDVYLEENESTLLEIEIISGGEDNTYKWLKDGKESMQNCQGSFLCLHKVDIDSDGSKFSRNFKLSAAKNPAIVVHVGCQLDQFRSDVASMYLAQPEVPEDTWPPVGNQKYINLALVKQNKIDYCSEFARLTIRGDMDDILQHKQTIECEDIYKSMTSGQLILIEGRPGSGKTTFVHKITQDWASKTDGAIRLLLLVSLRVLNTFANPDLSDILKLFKDLKVSQEVIEI